MSPPSETALPTGVQPEYSPDERHTLLQIAHDAILSALEHRAMQDFAISPHLSEPRGAFTTLYYRSAIRGCVGYPLAASSLDRTVVETARAAAFNDPRFRPVTLEQARELRVSISVLSPLSPIKAEEVEVGRHGLLLSRSGQRGLLLPQVPVEHGWDRITFLEQTCRKAGLPANAWQSGATIEAFTAEVFGDEESDP